MELIRPCLILIGFAENILFIWTVIKVPALHTATLIYLASLACSDFFVLIGLGIQDILDTIKIPLRFTTVLGIPPLIVSIFIIFVFKFSDMTLVSIDRYLAICPAIKHHIFKRNKANIQNDRNLSFFFLSLLNATSFTLITPGHFFFHLVGSFKRKTSYTHPFLGVLMTVDQKMSVQEGLVQPTLF